MLDALGQVAEVPLNQVIAVPRGVGQLRQLFARLDAQARSQLLHIAAVGYGVSRLIHDAEIELQVVG